MGMDNLSSTTASSVGMTFDPRNLEIKTKSIEKTLVPLVSQITTLVSIKENFLANGRPKSEKVIRSALKVGSAVEAAIERFVAVGETIADENSDIQPEMYDACHEARLAGSAIANLCGSVAEDEMHGIQPHSSAAGFDKSVLLRATRQLLSSVTRVLLLADRVMVKNILRAEDKIAYSLTRLETTANFTDFVKIFTEFGGEMVDLAHRSGDRQHDLKSDKRRAQMGVARSNLERQTMLLLTSSKTLLRHPDDQAALQCRDGVFYQIRLSLQLITLCVTDGVMIFDNNRYVTAQPNDEPIDLGMQLTASAAIRQLMEMLEMVRMTSTVGSVVRERLVSALDSLCEMTQDFTDSAYTPHHHREQILDFLEECRFEMSNLIQPEQDQCESLRGEGIEVTVERLNRRLKDLRKQLQIVAMDQISDVFRSNDDQTILSSIKACSISGDIDGVEKYLEKFREHSEHIQEVCRLLHHISLNDTLHIHTGHSERTLRALAPLTLLAGRTFCIHPSSRIARENLEVFCDTWAHNVNELSRLAKESDAAASGRIAAEKQAYMSLPRPGVSSMAAANMVASMSGGSDMFSSVMSSSSSACMFPSECVCPSAASNVARSLSNLRINSPAQRRKADSAFNIVRQGSEPPTLRMPPPPANSKPPEPYRRLDSIFRKTPEAPPVPRHSEEQVVIMRQSEREKSRSPIRKRMIDEEQKNFTYRMSLILDDLQNEAEF
ncbi:hypothetical protein QR680_008384 [Steinernema hermaphroditum]|uniref:Alpha-catenin n=1 Tax=Steinernema hermaphroditum TaxID=289476 RepID=A0AA39IHW2_9BILA|nr:hypothetical protein QR680_008384 [Steinernema hermaphroditum]